jgi:FKBP-type peptidyl-prolyl cis-trans isomerase
MGFNVSFISFRDTGLTDNTNKDFPMKKAVLALALSSAMLATPSQATELTTDDQKLSYGMGLVLGERLMADFDSLDYDLLSQGVKDMFEGNKPLMTMQELSDVMMAFQAKKLEAEQAKEQALADTNLKNGQDFMAENAKREGVVTTDTGLQVEILEEGTGPTPTAEDNVKVHYKGMLINGQEFDSSYGRGEPVTFPLSGVIKGWTEGLQMIKEGGKGRLVIPSDLAYGPGGAGGMIGPNATLVFEVELLAINPAE